jgi:hypothetical protein
MARLTKAQREWRPDMPKKRRSIKVMFSSVVLSLEAFVVFFATLAAFGLHDDRIPQPVILTAGIALSLVLVVSCALLTRPFGYPLGWILQLVLIVTGFVEPMMFIVGTMFAAAWWYGLRAGGRLDRENARRDREQAEWERNNPQPRNNPEPEAGGS